MPLSSSKPEIIYSPGPDPVSQSDPVPSVPLSLLSVCIIRCDVRDGTAGMGLPSFTISLGQQLIIPDRTQVLVGPLLPCRPWQRYPLFEMLVWDLALKQVLNVQHLPAAPVVGTRPAHCYDLI